MYITVKFSFVSLMKKNKNIKQAMKNTLYKVGGLHRMPCVQRAIERFELITKISYCKISYILLQTYDLSLFFLFFFIIIIFIISEYCRWDRLLMGLFIIF